MPPEPFRGRPLDTVLPAGTPLWRVHHEPHAATAFNPTLADPHWHGSRFDATARAPFSYLYAAPELSTAVAEVLLRNRGFAGRARPIRRGSLAGQRLSRIRLVRALRLITLVSSTDLAAIYQDDWIVQAEARDYGKTRRWAAALRDADPTAEGLIWQSRVDRPKLSLVLFGDRCDGAVGLDGGGDGGDGGGGAIRLDDPAGLELLDRVLGPYLAYVEPAPAFAPAPTGPPAATAGPESAPMTPGRRPGLDGSIGATDTGAGGASMETHR